MKKRMAFIICAVCLLFSGTSYAQTEDSEDNAVNDLYQQYTSSIPDKETEYEYMSLDDFTEKALRNDTSNKKLSSNIDLYEKQSDYYGETYSSSFSYTNLYNLLSSQNNYKNARTSKKAAEEEVKYSAKEVYAGIITDERALVVSEASLKLNESKLNLAKAKNGLGLISDDELAEQQQTYNQSVEDYKNKQEALELSYQALNSVIGETENKRYKFELPLVYEELVIDGTIDTYAKAKAQAAASAVSAEQSLDTAEQMFNIRGFNEDSTEPYNYDSLKNDINEASLSLQDQLESVEDSIRTLYNTIKTQESSINLNISELERLKKLYDTAEKKYEAGTANLIEVEEAKQSVVEKEYEILQEMYSHMLNVEKFGNMDLF